MRGLNRASANASQFANERNGLNPKFVGVKRSGTRYDERRGNRPAHSLAVVSHRMCDQSDFTLFIGNDMPTIDILADQQNHEEMKPVNIRESIKNDICCAFCVHVQSYEDDGKYYCYKYHTNVQEFAVCGSFQE